MKKSLVIFFSCAVIIFVAVCGVAGFNGNESQTEVLRIHIRANSNGEEDQAVKYKVKDAVVSYLTPILSNCHTKEQAESVINANLENISAVADGVLKSNGFNYGANAKLNNEKFPTRVYENLTLSSGYYDAVIVELGGGKGDNWWCVVYPPLCFTGSGNYIYKSKIRQIIDEFFSKERV